MPGPTAATGGGAGGVGSGPASQSFTAGNIQNIEQSITAQVITLNYDSQWLVPSYITNETTSLHMKLLQTEDENRWCIYGEIDGPGLEATGAGADNSGGFCKVFHKGTSGDAFNVIGLSQYAVGFEMASYVNGTRGFLGSIQYLSGSAVDCANTVHFVSLWDSAEVPNYGSFFSQASPGQSIYIEKYNGINDGAPAAADGVSQIRISENLTSAPGTANEGRVRWNVYNSGREDVVSLKADATNTLRNSPERHWIGAYWNGAATVDRAFKMVHNVEGESPDSAMYFSIGDLASEVTALILRNEDGAVTADWQANAQTSVGSMTFYDGNRTLNLNGSDISGIDDVTFAGATSLLDLQGGDISNVDVLTLLNSSGYLDLQGGQILNSGSITPLNDDTQDLGTNTKYWRYLYAKTGLVLEGGCDIYCSATTGTKICTTNGQKMAFWGLTPVVQPSSTGVTAGFTAGAGSAVLDDSTFTGNTGTTAYTIGDLVAHLKTIGLIVA